jgi:hypothetical protein
VAKDERTSETAPAGAPAGELAPVKIELPKRMFKGTPRPVDEPNIEKPLGRPRPPFVAPRGTVNLARGKRVTSSELQPIIGELEMVTDGDKKAADGSFVELGSGRQWIQIDLEQEAYVYAVVVWHYHAQARAYRDVVVQLARAPDFIMDVRTVFNNDHDNSSRLGVGGDKGYVETYEGKLIDCNGTKARYVRLYSNGNTSNEQNHYIEVEVYGRGAQ